MNLKTTLQAYITPELVELAQGSAQVEIARPTWRQVLLEMVDVVAPEVGTDAAAAACYARLIMALGLLNSHMGDVALRDLIAFIEKLP